MALLMLTVQLIIRRNFKTAGINYTTYLGYVVYIPYLMQWSLGVAI